MSKVDLNSKTKSDLLKMAERLGLRGISTMNKPELVTAISRAQQGRREPLRKQASAMLQKAAASIKRRAVRKRVVAKAPAKSTPKRASTKAPKTSKPSVSKPKPAAEVGYLDHRSELSREPVTKRVFPEENLGELPESYGTGRLFLAARDPHWLFAYWDFTGDQLHQFRRQSSDGRLLLRVFEKNHAHALQEYTLHQHTRNWYLHVPKSATTYLADMGFWRHDGTFNVIAQSGETATPADSISTDTTVRFATLPVDIPFPELVVLVRQHSREGERLAETLQRLQNSGFNFPFKVGIEVGPWNPEQAAQLQQVLGGYDLEKRIQLGSLEFTEWLRRRLLEQTSSAMFSPSSPFGASWSGHSASLGQPKKGFWFAVNAELIIYGATEPDAKVTIDGKPIQLRADGTFSFHFSFPDGQFRLPIIAASSKTGEKREVQLKFDRQTQMHGEVGKVQPAAHLKPPTPE